MNKEILGIRIKAWLCALLTIGLIVGFVCLCSFFPNIILKAVAGCLLAVNVCLLFSFFLVIIAIGFDMNMK